MELSSARGAVAVLISDALSDDVSVVDHLPDSITPPCVLIAWSNPWIKPNTFCNFIAAMEIIIVAQRLEPGGKLETLEEIVSALIPVIKSSHDFQTVDVTAPYPMQVAGVDYLAASINITHDLEG